MRAMPSHMFPTAHLPPLDLLQTLVSLLRLSSLRPISLACSTLGISCMVVVLDSAFISHVVLDSAFGSYIVQRMCMNIYVYVKPTGMYIYIYIYTYTYTCICVYSTGMRINPIGIK